MHYALKPVKVVKKWVHSKNLVKWTLDRFVGRILESQARWWMVCVVRRRHSWEEGEVVKAEVKSGIEL